MFTNEFEKIAVLRSYPKSFDKEKTEDDGEYPYTRAGRREPTSMNEIEFDILRGYAGIKHSPLTRGAATGSKWGLGVGLPIAAIAAMAASKGNRLKKALLLGASFGAPAGVLAGGLKMREQVYRNKLEDAHINYHLDRMGYVPGK